MINVIVILLDENKLLILFFNEFENEVLIEFYDCDFKKMELLI